jgi:hypothetical protein
MALCAESANGAIALATAGAAATPDDCGALTEAACAGLFDSTLLGVEPAAGPLTGIGAKKPTGAVALAAG